MEAYCFQAYADALEVIPTTLAENAGLNPIAIVTELRNRHALGERNAGINVRKVSTSLCQRSEYRGPNTHQLLGANIKYIRRGCGSAALSYDERRRASNGNSVIATQG